MTDVVGTILLLAVAVSFVAVMALQINAASHVPEIPMRVEITASGGADRFELLHVGGTTLDLGDIRMLVSHAGNIEDKDPVDVAGTMWGLGDVLTITTALPAGPADVTIVHRDLGRTIATTAVKPPVVGAGPPPGGFTLAVTLDGSGSTPTVTPPTQVLAEVTATHGEGRKLIRHVYADLSGIDGPLWFSLRDDGTRGDRVAGDRVWSGQLNVPVSAPPGDNTIRFVGVDLDGYSVEQTAVIRVV